MATFRVGQRVRVTGCYAGASDWVVSRVGQETTIVEVGVLFPAAPGNLAVDPRAKQASLELKAA